MKRRSRSHELYTVSLFPFLAVLICTFGVLIILLVIVVKAAEVHADTAKAAQQTEHDEQFAAIQQELDLQLLRVEGLHSIRPDLLKKLNQEKIQRAHLQADIDKLTDELMLLNQKFELLATNPDGSADEQLQTELAALTRQLGDEQDLLEKRRRASADQPSVKYSVVPYDGPDGTNRRPIYVECKKTEFVIQPYGIRLQRGDFVAPVLPNNPLDAALIAVREYFLKNKLDDGQGTPYPLLIVRPDGSDAYALARHAMKSWDEEFGYELIAADKELDFGVRDPQLEQEILLAVNAARNRQRKFLVDKQLKRSPPDSHFRNAGGLHASSQFGGFVAPDGRVHTAAGVESRSQPTTDDSPGGDTPSHARREADIAVAGLKAEGKTIAQDRGQDSALPSVSEGAVAYRRPVKIYLSDSRIVMDSDSRSNQRMDITIANEPADAIQDLVEAIWQRIDTWGVAGVGGYWKPELDVVVLPGGENRYREMESLLYQSGIDIKEHRR